jgi:hypothetical protein
MKKASTCAHNVKYKDHKDACGRVANRNPGMPKTQKCLFDENDARP